MKIRAVNMHLFKMAFWTIVGMLISLSAMAEYRAFLLRITNPEGEPRFLQSNLDPIQYKMYFHLKPGETVTYDTSWMCYGRTSGQSVCHNPASIENAEEAAPVETASEALKSP